MTPFLQMLGLSRLLAWLRSAPDPDADSEKGAAADHETDQEVKLNVTVKELTISSDGDEQHD